LTVFRDVQDDTTTSTTSSVRHLESGVSPVIFLGTILSRQQSKEQSTSDLLAVRKDGTISCFSGEELSEKWSSPATILNKEDHLSSQDITVEFAQLTTAFSASQGLLKNRPDLLSSYPEEVSESGFNPELLVLVTVSAEVRTVRIVAMPQRSIVGAVQQSVDVLLSIELPTLAASSQPAYSLHASSGILQLLSNDIVQTYDLTNTLPKSISKMRTNGADSFLRLSNTSLMVAHGSSVTVYNPKYQSILASVDTQVVESVPSKRRRVDAENNQSLLSIKFCTYFPKLGVAVALSGSQLVAFQIEGQLDRQGRPRATGLLIDSLGCSAKDQFTTSRSKRSKTALDQELKTLDMSKLASSAALEAAWSEEVAGLESAVKQSEPSTFDELLAAKLGTSWESESLVNGASAPAMVNGDKAKSHVLSSSSKRRWQIYAISKVFKLVEEGTKTKLSVAFYAPNTFTWLLQDGAMSISNIQTALKSKTSLHSTIPAGNLVDILEELDPSFEFLLLLLSQNYLPAEEILHAIKRLMISLGLFGESAGQQALLTNGEEIHEEKIDSDDQLSRLEAEAENDLALAEYQLDAGSGVRGQALSVALSKLYTCPSNAIVYAIQTTFTTAETVSLIYLLRFELGRGAWTSRYLDLGENIIDEEAEIPNNAIVSIASLLNNCVDAIGAGGWLTGEARLVNGDPFEAQELITSLKLEVGAALEGIEEAKYLNGLISEMIRYGDQVQKVQKRKVDDSSEKKRKGKPSRPVIVQLGEQEKMLPYGLKSEKVIAFQRVGAGGEVQERSKRDIGHLKSQKVGKYTLERIVV